MLDTSCSLFGQIISYCRHPSNDLHRVWFWQDFNNSSHLLRDIYTISILRFSRLDSPENRLLLIHRGGITSTIGNHISTHCSNTQRTFNSTHINMHVCSYSRNLGKVSAKNRGKNNLLFKLQRVIAPDRSRKVHPVHPRVVCKLMHLFTDTAYY